MSLLFSFSFRRYDSIINLLLRGVPCTSCGLRFTSDEKDDYQKHLDWHYRDNRMDKEGTKSISRNWYIHSDVSVSYALLRTCTCMLVKNMYMYAR